MLKKKIKSKLEKKCKNNDKHCQKSRMYRGQRKLSKGGKGNS